MKKTKIIATIGPVSGKTEMLEQMVMAGMNIARLNFSHGDYEMHAQFIENIRKVSAKLRRPVGIIQDLHGPKVRVGKLSKPIEVKVGDTVIIGKDFDLSYDVSKWVRPKQHILIEDGLIELEITKIAGKRIQCMALTPGKIQERKGLNLPRTKLKFPILTEKDIQDLKFGLQHDVDYIALSFVRNRKDIVNLKKYIKKYNPKGHETPKIIAKIECLEGVKRFDEILAEADAIMVARGDLGVEVPESEVPLLQKTFIQKCLRVAKPVIVATQMLDSMIRNPRPTRAEVSDVANAVIDQTDCVMLSGETAFGKYPLKAVSAMNKIIETTEKSPISHSHVLLPTRAISRSDAIAESAFQLAKFSKVKIIVGATMSGFTAREISHERPHHARIVMFTPKDKVYRQMSLLWGVSSFMIQRVQTYEELIKTMLEMVRREKLVKKGEQLLIVTGEPLGQRENLNVVEVKTA
ncbi:MAG: pyruvate kinase [Candidatus Saccharibacteria bacterium]